MIEKIIRQERLRASPKPHKRTTKYRHQEQIVTGVKVNKRLDAPKQKTDEIRNELNDLRVMSNFGKNLSRQKISSIKGKIRYVKTLNRQIGIKLENKLKRILNRAS